MKISTNGYYNGFGGKYVPETLVFALDELEKGFKKAWRDKKFKKELHYYLSRYAGRPTPLYYAKNISQEIKRKVYLKREDLCYTGSHKINNTIGQTLLALRLNKKRIIAETGAGQHGIATAVTAKLFNLKCDIHMGEVDIERQAINVYRMKMTGANVLPVKSGNKTLKEAVNESLRDWVTNVRDTYYLLGSAVGPHPYPLIVKMFQLAIGSETKKQILKAEGRLPDYLVACIGGGSNAIGLFWPFYNDKEVKFIGIEPEGAATLSKGSVGILHGMKTFVLQNEDGQIKETSALAPGLDYPGVGPEHVAYMKSKRASYYTISDDEAVEAFKWLSKLEGIIPALEPAYAIAYIKKYPHRFKKDSIIVVCLSGRGDKDLDIVRKYG